MRGATRRSVSGIASPVLMIVLIVGSRLCGGRWNGMSAKPKSEICDKCEVIHNKLCCSLCKHATEEWIFSDDGACVVGDLEYFKEKSGKAE